jgi:hypothetical protein
LWNTVFDSDTFVLWNTVFDSDTFVLWNTVFDSDTFVLYRIPPNKCIGLNTVTLFDNYSIKKQQIYVLDLFIPIIRKTNVSYSNTVFHKKKTRTHVFLWNTVFDSDTFVLWNMVFDSDTFVLWNTVFDSDTFVLWNTVFDSDTFVLWNTVVTEIT